MKIRFGKNDILDTKNIEGEVADISELEGQVNGLSNAVSGIEGTLGEILIDSDYPGYLVQFCTEVAKLGRVAMSIDSEGALRITDIP